MSPGSGSARSGRSFCLLGALFLLLSAPQLSVRGDHCMQLETCGDCISSHFRCKWCIDPFYNGSRCVNLTADGNAIGCRAGFEDPIGSFNIEREDAFGGSTEVKPQQLSLQLRPGVATSFEVKVKPASNFPLDVYFLMDFSQSMRNNLDTLQRLAYGTVSVIQRISTNSRVGFGSFVDKRTFPMMGATFHERRNPCAYSGERCEQTYSFRHHLNLTGSPREFYLTLQQAKISGNFDPPEGGADALLQAIVCTDVVGWRPAPARRLLVYISDAEMHFSYDGKLGGVVTPHDGLCHTSQATNFRGFPLPYYDYQADTRLDYPSLSMIVAKLQEFNIYPIFAVSNASDPARAAEIYQMYQNLSANIPFSAVERMSDDSSNIVEALNRAYLRIASRVSLSVAQGDLDYLDIRFEADCDGSGWTGNDTCGSVLVGDEVSFRVSVTAKQCTPQLRNGSQLILSSGFFGLVLVNVKTICECSCSKTPVIGAPECYSFGSLTCGTCECGEGRYGRFCECGAYDNGTIPQCPVGSNGEQCSGPLAGECSCGQCHCSSNVGGVEGHHYFGPACECNNFECNKDTQGRMCSGRGTCECGGVCECDTAPSGKPYTGEICECYPDVDVCQATEEDVPCSGHGLCECGICKCQPGYSGTYCQACVNKEICGLPECSDVSDCISCIIQIVDGALIRQDQDACFFLCNDVNVTLTTDSSLVTSLQVDNGARKCSSYRTSQRCDGPVYYLQRKEKRVYVVDGSQSCTPVPAPIPHWVMIVPIVVGLLLFAVIAIIAAKLIIVFLDYREYRAWKEDLKKVHFPETENPLYKSAWQTFYCPIYPGNLEKGLVGTTSALLRLPSLSSIKDDEGETDTTTVTSSQREGESPLTRHRTRHAVAHFMTVDGNASPTVELRSREAEGPSILVAVTSDSDSAKSEDHLLRECNIEDLIESLTADQSKYRDTQT